MKTLFLAMLPMIAALATPAAASIPSRFAAVGTDAAAIRDLLDTYTRAVSTKDQALFETLLLSLQVPFSGVPDAGFAANPSLQGYAEFRKGVFQGQPFTQRFENVNIRQDGPLANVTLVFVNSSAGVPSTWGWKTLQLLKVEGRWRIASEFYTGHSLGKPKH